MSGSPSSSAAADASSAGGGGEGDGGGGGGPGDLGGRRVVDPSSSRPRSAEAVWPDHFVEAVATRVGVDAAQTQGRLAAAPALATVFQVERIHNEHCAFCLASCLSAVVGDFSFLISNLVCSAWRSVSRSELLWEEVTRRVWSCHHRSLPSWRAEFCRLHRTAVNFRVRRCTHAHILPPSGDISCRRLALSDSHLAAGFSDGTVRLFHLPTGQHLTTFGPHPEQARLGPYSQSISGLGLLSDRLVFAFQDGDVHVASLDSDSFRTAAGPAVRRANVGNPVDDGPLVDFACDSGSRWWVGLFAGVPGRSWHVWDGETEQLVYVGGSLTEPDAVMGWHMLTDLSGPALGRVRIPEPGIAVGCTGSRMQVISLEGGDVGSTVGYLEFRRGAIVDTMDGCDGRVVVLDRRRMGKVRRARGLEEVCRFSGRRRGGDQIQQQQEEQEEVVVVASMNWGYIVICSSSGSGGGEIRVWDAVTGEHLYRLRERIGEASVVAASDRYVSAWSADTGLHLWDFGAAAAAGGGGL